METPCPDKILDDCGGAYCMGLVGGGVWHFFKGMRNSPRGDRMSGGFNSVILRAPTLGGAFAVWGGLFATFDCTYAHLRKKEDPWNAIASGATTGGILAARAGWKAMGKNALIGGFLLAMIEGLGILVEKAFRQEAPVQGVMAPPTRLTTSMPEPGITTPSFDMNLGANVMGEEELDFDDIDNALGTDILDDFDDDGDDAPEMRDKWAK